MTDQTEMPERTWVAADLTAWCHDPMGIRETDIEYIRADLSDAKIAEAEQRGYASAMDAERKDADARIAELETKLARTIVHKEDYAAAFVRAARELQQQGDRCEELEAKLAKALVGLRECEEEIDGYIRQEYPGEHPVQARYRARDFAANPARTTLAALKGTD